VKLGDKFEKRTSQVLTGMRKTAIAGFAIVAGVSQLDPSSAMPGGEPRDGQAAAWFVLARRDWRTQSSCGCLSAPYVSTTSAPAPAAETTI
jgi:hypothetical protein